jgi:signal transduction histidine kinase
LQDSLRRAEAMSAMGSLVAGVAHEVRNPIFGMSATLDAMEQRFATDAAREPFLLALRRELDRVNALMRDLLEYGRPPAVQLAPDALAPVVALAARSCIPVADMASVEIENNVGPEAGEVAMDAGRLAQVFQNLIENAVQHSPMGGKVRIDARRTPTHAAVRVTDSGPGFRPEDLGRIFEPFFSRRRGGTGLGLSIVQKIVEQHRGTIEAANRPEGGASVTVYLPV